MSDESRFPFWPRRRHDNPRWWLALLVVGGVGLIAYWVWRADVGWGWLVRIFSTWWWMRDVAATAGCVLLMWYAATRFRTPRPIHGDPTLRRLPGGGYLRWSAALALGVVVFAVATTLRILNPGGHRAVVKSVNLTLLTAIASAVALLLMVYGVFRVRLVYFARKPGPVEIPLLDNATSNSSAPVQECTLTLRRYLADANLYPQSLVPGNAPPEDFVSLVQAATSGKGRNLLSTIASLLAIFPTYAYRVHASLLGRENSDTPCGVSAQLMLRPRWMSAPVTYWARTWDGAIEQAAHAIAQEILPWSRAARGPTWGDWVDRQMPQNLFHCYQLAKAFVDQRRYDEALGAYHEALESDPGNLQLRLEIAAVDQKLALWLDALETYRNTIELAASRLPRRLRPSLTVRTRARRRSALQSYLVARYRYTVSLGWGDLLAQQWMKWSETDPDDAQAPARDRERAALRKRLSPCLVQAVGRAGYQLERAELASSNGTRSKRLLHDLAQPVERVRSWLPKNRLEPSKDAVLEAQVNRILESHGEDTKSGSQATIQLLFQILAYEEAQDIRTQRFKESLWRQHVGLTAVSWELFAILTVLRLELAVRGAAGPFEKEDEAHRVDREVLLGIARRQLQLARRDPSAHDQEAVGIWVKKAVDDALRRGHPEWLDHYNAACVLAVLIPDDDSSAAKATRDDVSAKAVAQLDTAMRQAGTARLLRLRPWIASEDPDLRVLRETLAFRSLATRYFPGRPPQTTRPTNAHRFELALHTAQTIRRSARVFADHWHAQSDRPMPTSSTVLRMWAQEVDAWKSIETMARNSRHWQTRLELMNKMTSWSAEYRFDAPDWRHPEFPAVVEQRADSTKVEEWISAFDDRFDDAAKVLLDRTEGLVPAVREWDEYLRDLDAAGLGLTQSAWERLCVQQCRVWRRLQDWFSDDPHVTYRRTANWASLLRDDTAGMKGWLAPLKERLDGRGATAAPNSRGPDAGDDPLKADLNGQPAPTG